MINHVENVTLNACLTSRVIIISYEKNDIETIQNIGFSLGFYAIAFDSIQNCLENLEFCIPDIIFIDTTLPGISALSVLEYIKSYPELSKINMIVITSIHAPDDEIIDALESGASDVISKPIKKGELFAKIKNIIRIKQKEKDIIKLNETIRLEQEKVKLERDLLSQYFSKDLMNSIINGELGLKIGGEIRTATILFCDLRNSTAMSESVEPDLFAKFLNNFFMDITDIIIGGGGSVNKFLGDGLMVTFGCPKKMDNDAYNCAHVAVKIRKYLNNFNQFKPKYLLEPIRMGVGMARGDVFAGTIGSVNQIEYTVIGNPVNLASRLEYLTKKLNYDILMDENMYQEIIGKATARKIANVQIRGRTEKTVVYHLESIE